MKDVERKTAVLHLSRSGRLSYLGKSLSFPELAPAKLERIRKSVIDSVDPIRYIVASVVGKHVFYYRVEGDSYGSHISMATLFKRFKTADAVRKSIGRARKDLQIGRVKKIKAGVRLVDKIKFRR